MNTVLRKTPLHVETTLIEGGRAAPVPLKLIAAAIIYNEKASAATGMPSGRYGNPNPVPGYTPGYTHTGGRSGTGAKGQGPTGNTYIINVDGATKTTHAAIEAGARKGTKQAILAYNRRAA